MDSDILIASDLETMSSSSETERKPGKDVSSSPYAVVIENKPSSTPLRGSRQSSVAGSLPYEVLDLAFDTVESSELCRETMKLLMNAKRMIVVAGAGISVAAGIPDFRSPVGLFSTLKADTKFKPSGKELFDASVYKVLYPLKKRLTCRVKKEHNRIMR
jgi:Sir2 family